MKYPDGLKKDYTKTTTYDNRGMNLENMINATNTFYLENGIAIIHKKPTPITIVKVSYPSRNKAVIHEAYFKTPSTTDYNGIYKGKYIDFEAKETNKDIFPLANIHKHQIIHLENIHKMGGIGFVIVSFNKINKIYLLKIDNLLEYLKTDKKSIPFSYFEKYGYLVEIKYIPRLDYLKIIDSLYFEGGKV